MTKQSTLYCFSNRLPAPRPVKRPPWWLCLKTCPCHSSRFGRPLPWVCPIASFRANYRRLCPVRQDFKLAAQFYFLRLYRILQRFCGDSSLIIEANLGLKLLFERLFLEHFHSGWSWISPISGWAVAPGQRHFWGRIDYFGYQFVTYLNLALTVSLDFNATISV